MNSDVLYMTISPSPGVIVLPPIVGLVDDLSVISLEATPRNCVDAVMSDLTSVICPSVYVLAYSLAAFKVAASCPST